MLNLPKYLVLDYTNDENFFASERSYHGSKLWPARSIVNQFSRNDKELLTRLQSVRAITDEVYDYDPKVDSVAWSTRSGLFVFLRIS